MWPEAKFVAAAAPADLSGAADSLASERLDWVTEAWRGNAPRVDLDPVRVSW